MTTAGSGSVSGQLFFRNRSRSILELVVLAALLVTAAWFVGWSLLNPTGVEELVEKSWRQRLVIALPFALLSLPALVALVVIMGRRAADSRPLLVLDRSGIFYRDWRVGRVRWADVADCQLIEVDESRGGRARRPVWYLEVRLRNPDDYLRKLHGGGEFSESYGRRYFRIPLSQVGGERAEVLRAVEGGLNGSRC